ncbi:hypothetical protein Pcinc_039587 [Petrolisthes cinctipes]|uniref:Uncharacterized protein n=2 Tax=Petrolisthes cinctipes TaxID=88211 RepID=A0AAE1BNY6_PETCI|nr:hypothetical protein Pcinc_039587 [Petrolisthes cinctipes]
MSLLPLPHHLSLSLTKGLGKYGTAITAVGSLITVVLVVFYVEHILFTYRNCHSVFRRHINWIACFYPLGAFMSLLALLVPRSYDICTAVKLVFFSLGISHFTDLTVTMFGCEKAMLAKLTETRFTLHVGLLRWCPFIPSPRVTKIRLRLVKWSLWQLPYTQCLFYFFQIYWTTAETDNYGRFSLNYAYLVLDVVDAVSFLMAMYAFAVLAKLVGDQLHNFNYKRKSATMLLVLVILKVPQLVIRILGNYDFFPCLPPYINSMVYFHTVVSLIHLVLVTIFGGLEYWQYHTQEFLYPTSDKHHTHSHELIIHGDTCVCIISEMNLGSHGKEQRRGSDLFRRGSANLPPIVLENKMALEPPEKYGNTLAPPPTTDGVVTYDIRKTTEENTPA